MSEPIITGTALTNMMERFGNEAALKAQSETRKVFPGGWLPPSVVMALGARESMLQNICGGAVLVNGVWKPSYTDRGFLQISDTIPENQQWLSTVPGCPNGSWNPETPIYKGVFRKTLRYPALLPLHCPTFSAALQYTLAQIETNRVQAGASGVKPTDVLRFVIAAHNAGFQGALDGYNNGDVDEFTTHGDYSGWVMAEAPVIATWISVRPNWQV